jgi:transcriptional regulator with XRE-family HTH domain
VNAPDIAENILENMTENTTENVDHEVHLDEDGVLLSLGAKCRAFRRDRHLTLQTIAERTGLSPSMISMVERGRTSPSIGTLVAISSALGVRVSDLFDGHETTLNPVNRLQDQDSLATATGVHHRAAVVAGLNGIGMNMNTYEVGAESAPEQLHHAGYECAVVLEGTLKIELESESYVLHAGDSISYDSGNPHRITNHGDVPAKAVWVNVAG